MFSDSTLELIVKSLPQIFKGAMITLQTSLCVLAISLVLGLLFGIVQSHRLRKRWISLPIDFFVLVIRGTPLFIQVLIANYIVPDLLNIDVSPFVIGVIALGLNSTAYVTEIIRSGINGISVGQWEAGYVLGYNLKKSLLYIIFPQMLRYNISTITSELIMLIKETSILATIGLLELTKIAMNINARHLQPIPIYLVVAAFYLILTTSITFVSKKLEKVLE
jgi:polar amino acid transport system permease protein